MEGVNPELIAQLRDAIHAPVVVEVLGVELELIVPSLAQSLEVRSLLFKTIDDKEKDAESYLTTSVEAVKVCLPPDLLTEEDIAGVILRTGGEKSPLVIEAMKLVGLGDISKTLTGDSPIPFS